MAYRIEQERARDPFGHYRYRIYKDGTLVANYWHDYRDDEHGIDFLGGSAPHTPMGCMADFLAGGGSEPLGLSELGVAYGAVDLEVTCEHIAQIRHLFYWIAG